jgi:hypothetical protein
MDTLSWKLKVFGKEVEFMRRTSVALLTLAAALVVAGCSNNKGKIEETKWSSQEAKVKGQETQAGSRQLQFGKDGHLIYVVGSTAYQGSYSLGMGSAVTLTLDQELEGRRIHPHKLVVDGDLLTMTNADGSEMKFQRTK